ncbi:hypothetical protein [uncultured Sphingomonas sp.]|uniref:hypothetical protein n=1 Tax=uncultured Sphingomonas sp. TaxID=158754 RepID=UPI0025CF5DBC|nr:hypothetical protein [uncultured Sphingomonas sp.]
MKMLVVTAALAAALSISAGLSAQTAEPLQAIAAAKPSDPATTLPANTEVVLSMNQDLTTKGAKIDVGTKFDLSVAYDVMIGDYVVIPKGTPAVGEVVWKTGKGAFGKSGKMEVEMRSINLNGRRIPVSGKYRQEGEGNTVATVASVALIWPVAPFVTGKSARIPQGRELKAYTVDALPVSLPAGAVVAPVAAVARPASTTTN